LRNTTLARFYRRNDALSFLKELKLGDVQYFAWVVVGLGIVAMASTAGISLVLGVQPIFPRLNISKPVRTAIASAAPINSVTTGNAKSSTAIAATSETVGAHVALSTSTEVASPFPSSMLGQASSDSNRKDELQRLIIALQDKDDWKRQKALKALVESGGPIKRGDFEAIEPLITAINDPKFFTFERQWAVRRLGEIGSEKAIPALVRILTGPNDDGFHPWAIKALGLLKIQPAVPILLSYLSACDRARTAGTMWVHVDEAISDIGTDGVPALIDAAMGSVSGVARDMAIRWLGEVGDPRALDVLTGLLSDQNESRRAAAGSSLGKIADPRSVEALQLAQSDKSESVRGEATRALERIRRVSGLVLLQVARGRTDKDIAAALQISAETVKEHVEHLLHKLGVTDRTQAADWVVRNGLADVGNLEQYHRALAVAWDRLAEEFINPASH
jgi:HEAT repeat protein